MNKSESIKELATALCKFQAEVETIRKKETNPFFKSKYADLSSILNVIKDPLTKNGLSFVQFPSGEYGLTTILMHISGEWIEESYKMTPVKNDPQGAGSVITYQRRYALGAILGLNIDEDDDGNKGSGNHNGANEAKPEKPWTTEKQADQLIARIRGGEDQKALMLQAGENFRMSRAILDKLNFEIEFQNQLTTAK